MGEDEVGTALVQESALHALLQVIEEGRWIGPGDAGEQTEVDRRTDDRGGAQCGRGLPRTGAPILHAAPQAVGEVVGGSGHGGLPRGELGQEEWVAVAAGHNSGARAGPAMSPAP